MCWQSLFLFVFCLGLKFNATLCCFLPQNGSFKIIWMIPVTGRTAPLPFVTAGLAGRLQDSRTLVTCPAPSRKNVSCFTATLHTAAWTPLACSLAHKSPCVHTGWGTKETKEDVEARSYVTLKLGALCHSPRHKSQDLKICFSNYSFNLEMIAQVLLLSRSTQKRHQILVLCLTDSFTYLLHRKYILQIVCGEQGWTVQKKRCPSAACRALYRLVGILILGKGWGIVAGQYLLLCREGKGEHAGKKKD